MNAPTPDNGYSVSGQVTERSALARWGAVVWPSFFAAGVATMVFFAIVDPLELADITWPHLTISRQLGYTLGFFGFWSCTFASSLFSTLLLGHFNKAR
jgi:hypothetical protein